MASLQAALNSLKPNPNANRPPASITALPSNALEAALAALQPNPAANQPPASIAAVPDWYGSSTPTDDGSAALLASIMNQPVPNFNQQASSQLAGVYDPQYAAINKAKGSATSTSKANQAQLNAMYGALGKDITSQLGQIQSTYGNAKNVTDQAYNEGRSGIANAYNSAAADNAHLLQSLGLQAAAADPRMNAQQMNQSAFLQSLLSANNQGAQNALTQEQKGAQDYNTAQRGVINAQHGEQDYELAKSLQNRMSQLDDQNTTLHSAQAQAIQQLANQLSNQYGDQQSSLMKQIMDSQNSALQQHNADRQYDLDVQKFNHQMEDDTQNRQDRLDQQDFRNMGSADKGYYEAGQLFGQNQSKANQAMNLVMNTGAAGSYRDAFQFAQAVQQNAQKNNLLGTLPADQLKALAVYMFQQMDPQTTPAYLYGMTGYGG